MKKIIIDTDIGDDIDDAFAVELALNSPELEIIGITTVFRSAGRRAKMVKALLHTHEEDDIPVYAGISIPLIEKLPERIFDQYDEYGVQIPCQYTPEMDRYVYEKKNAVEFIIDSIMSMPGEITLVPIGPLTNIAVAIRIEPPIIHKIKGITLMGGYYTQDIPEWNILCDPEAARIVFTSGIPIHAVGLDVTLKCRLTPQQVAQFRNIGSSTSDLLSTMTEKWLVHSYSDAPVLHDPLTIGTLVNDNFVRFKKSKVKIMLDGPDRGKTKVIDKISEDGSYIEIAQDIDAKNYLEYFIKKIFKK